MTSPAGSSRLAEKRRRRPGPAVARRDAGDRAAHHRGRCTRVLGVAQSVTSRTSLWRHRAGQRPAGGAALACHGSPRRRARVEPARRLQHLAFWRMRSRFGHARRGGSPQGARAVALTDRRIVYRPHSPRRSVGPRAGRLRPQGPLEAPGGRPSTSRRRTECGDHGRRRSSDSTTTGDTKKSQKPDRPFVLDSADLS